MRGNEPENTIRFMVRVQPRAARDEIVGMHGQALKIRLTAPPVDDAANEALIELLADALGVTKRAVRIVAGTRGRSKMVEVVGVTREQVSQLATKGTPR